ncbi:MAG: preprotein translocase subunit SecY [Planctomyces sp.]|nr:preprotein translocase subunit SecY [Planctomyces sp.]
MFSKLVTIFRIPELRQKIILTMILLAVYRMGFAIPLPIIDQEVFGEAMKRMSQGSLGQIMQVVALFSASQLGNATIFGLGIMPYISASIIFQLLATVYPPLEALQKEGEAGRKKINEYTRYATVVLCLIQSYFWVTMLPRTLAPNIFLSGFDSFWNILGASLTMTAGTIFLMWLGEQIDEYGIGNGISLLIMAGIVAQMPAAGMQLLKPAFKTATPDFSLGSEAGIDRLLLLGTLFVCVILGVIAITQATRRIPIQSAKHVRGRRVLGGQRSFLPMRLNASGVMPIIFASSLLMFPMFMFNWLNSAFPNVQLWSYLSGMFSNSDRGYIYNLCYIALIFFFCYFWTGITFNPKDIANNLKDYGSFVPGYRPGARTADYLDHVMSRITYVGAAFLALIAVIPTVLAASMNIPFMIASFYGGTGLLIVVSVALDLVQKIDSHLVMRNKPGLLEAES